MAQKEMCPNCGNEFARGNICLNCSRECPSCGIYVDKAVSICPCCKNNFNSLSSKKASVKTNGCATLLLFMTIISLLGLVVGLFLLFANIVIGVSVVISCAVFTVIFYSLSEILKLVLLQSEQITSIHNQIKNKK